MSKAPRYTCRSGPRNRGPRRSRNLPKGNESHRSIALTAVIYGPPTEFFFPALISSVLTRWLPPWSLQKLQCLQTPSLCRAAGILELQTNVQRYRARGVTVTDTGHGTLVCFLRSSCPAPRNARATAQWLTALCFSIQGETRSPEMSPLAAGGLSSVSWNSRSGC